MLQLIDASSDDQWEEIRALVILGLNHEQQHQELLLTDIKHIFSQNPLKPAYRAYVKPTENTQPTLPELAWLEYEGGMQQLGHSGDGFAYDNETPAHQTYTGDFRIASRLVTNGEYLAFIADGGYQRPEFWLSDAWATVQQENWRAPLYWTDSEKPENHESQNNEWQQFTLEGMQAINPDEPVCHVSQYEADAYAHWAKKRLPTETEWEVVASETAINGNFYDDRLLKPVVCHRNDGIQQLYGDVWEWTSSPYSAYPGYKAAAGAIGEYNGKFMSSQIVLRGGSFGTSRNHIRPTYRNFFYPKDRWQFSGIRLAEDA